MRLQDIKTGELYEVRDGYRHHRCMMAVTVGVHSNVYHGRMVTPMRSAKADYVEMVVVDPDTREPERNTFGHLKKTRVACRMVRAPWDQQAHEKRVRQARAAHREEQHRRKLLHTIHQRLHSLGVKVRIEGSVADLERMMELLPKEDA